MSTIDDPAKLVRDAKRGVGAERYVATSACDGTKETFEGHRLVCTFGVNADVSRADQCSRARVAKL
jgi:hypothetical protein